MEAENLSPRIFAETIGVQQSTLSHILNNRNKPSLDVVMKIRQTYRHINLEWLLYGQGEMFSQSDMLPSSPQQSSLFDENGQNSASALPFAENRKETASESGGISPQPPAIEKVRLIEKPPRKITEIRIFFDDNTYETFKPER